MNYWSLKWLVETVVKNYKCPECNSEVNESNIDVIWAAWNTINIDVECSKCWKHSMIKSEIIAFDLSKIDFNNEVLNQIKTSIENIKSKSWITDSNQKKLIINKEKIEQEINDEKIIELNKNLKKINISAIDLFWED
jgi:hypothetical protein